MTSLLAAVVRDTAEAPDSSAVLDRVARRLTELADWVFADRLDEPDLVTRVAAHGRSGPIVLSPAMGPRSARRSSAGSVGLLPAVLDAPGQLLRLDRAALQAAASSDDVRSRIQAQSALDVGANEVLVVALVAHGLPKGVLTLGSRSRFTDADVVVVVDIALHVALALEAAQLLVVHREVARAMQTSLMPPVPRVPGLLLAARYVPAAQGLDVGGDWYDAFDVPGGLCVVVGDASGHDVAAATRMADLRNLLRAHAVDRGEGPAATLSRLERTADALSLDAGATCFVGLLRPPRDGVRQLLWSSAGHLPPVHLRGGHATLLETPADLMLGVEVGSRRTEQVTELLPGDVVVLCTDGLVESREAPLGERLEELRVSVERGAGDDPDIMAERMLRELGGQASDDVALLVVQVL